MGGNAFEYAYHRWLLHRLHSSFARGHLEHHANVGTPEEPEHTSLGKSPLHIAILFASNGIIVIVIDLLLGLGITPGIFVGWTVYLITAEEIHWRIHLNGWLPRGLRFARAYIPQSRHNDRAFIDQLARAQHMCRGCPPEKYNAFTFTNCFLMERG